MIVLYQIDLQYSFFFLQKSNAEASSTASHGDICVISDTSSISIPENDVEFSQTESRINDKTWSVSVQHTSTTPEKSAAEMPSAHLEIAKENSFIGRRYPRRNTTKVDRRTRFIKDTYFSFVQKKFPELINNSNHKML